MVITIDGPAGAGKSSVARAVARRLGMRYLDTGAMYRALALAVLERGGDPANTAEAASVAGSVRVELDGDAILLDGTDVTDRIRTAAVTSAAARVAQHEEVRGALLHLQRQAAAAGDVVMEGRDIGSAVVPDADLKIFLTASLEERALRRLRQLELEETPTRLAEVRSSIESRDEADRTRQASPLTKPRDAIVVDTTALSEEQVVDQIVRLASERRP